MSDPGDSEKGVEGGGTLPADTLPHLDPDLQAAFKEGNPAVVAAIKAGATTSQQVVDRMIQLGFVTGLPPEVQRLVTAEMARRDDPEGAAAARDRRIAVAEEAVFAGIVRQMDRQAEAANAASSGGGAAAGSGERTPTFDPMKFAEGMALINSGIPYTAFTAEQRAAVVHAVANGTREEWGQMSQESRLNADKAVEVESLDTVKAGGQVYMEARRNMLGDTHLGATPEEREKNVAAVESPSRPMHGPVPKRKPSRRD